LVRDHCRIENCLHYVRDVTLREDACRVCKGNAPQVLAALRDAAQTQEALELLGLPSLE
jgi:predicted transposase YbfD/YdcC